MAAVLVAHLDGEIEEPAEAALELGVALDLTVDVADDAAEPGAQELERSAGAPELMGVAVAPDHDGGALGHTDVTLPQHHAVPPGQCDQLLQGRCMSRASVGCAIAPGTVLSTATRWRSLVLSAPVLCATDRLSWISPTSCSSPRRWRQRVIEERSNGSLWQKLSSPQKY